MIVDDKQLTVAELIRLLQGMPQEALVWTEGCDCEGEANGVYYDDDGIESGIVMITRK